MVAGGGASVIYRSARAPFVQFYLFMKCLKVIVCTHQLLKDFLFSFDGKFSKEFQRESMLKLAVQEKFIVCFVIVILSVTWEVHLSWQIMVNTLVLHQNHKRLSMQRHF